ncbi:MAG: hypothetical protein KIT25_01420 [Enhydrobacter sp.]|nr:MAG: hypothetical protein KIT25_01420 [Enhydrobacter sp.]
MSPTFTVALLVCAILGAFLGWSYGTRHLYRRPRSRWASDEIPKERISRRLLARRKRQRIEYALTAAVIAPVILYVTFVGFNTLVDMMRAAN